MAVAAIAAIAAIATMLQLCSILGKQVEGEDPPVAGSTLVVRQ